jgi:Tol biopolymer transport system component
MATRRQPPLAREVVAVWLLFAVVAAEVFATYSRLQLRELYHVSGTGPAAGLGRALVFLNFPTALVALPILAFVAGRLWPLATVAAVLCCGVFWPGVVDQADLDAKWANAIPAAGVLIALVLTALRARDGIAPSVRMRGDRVRVAVAAVLLLLSSPWIAADLGLSFGDMNAWWAPFGQARLHHAVHHGHHHGMDGTLLVLTALLLSRALGSVPRRLRRPVGIYLGILTAYGLGNVLNDAWLEQLVKRGWTSVSMPSVLLPAPSLAWALIVVVGVPLGVLYLRDRESAVPVRRRINGVAVAAVGSAAVLALVVVGAIQDRHATEGTPFARSGAGTIVFPMSTEGPFHLYEIGADGRGVRQLTDEDASDLAPSWSPQGLLAFQSSRDDRASVFVSDADVTAVERITGSDREGEPAWAPNGERIAYIRDGDLYLAYAHGGGAVELADDAAWPAFAPRTSLLAYEKTSGSRHDLETLASDGDTETVRTGTDSDSRRPAWSPRADVLAYECRQGEHWHICAFDPRSGTHRTLTPGDADEFAPAWSPDGRRIAFLSDRDGNDQLYVMRADGTRIVRLTTGQADKEAPAWRP